MDHVTPYDRCAWNDTVAEHLLATGEHAREVAAFFGARDYERLARLARRAAQVPISADTLRVYIVPGIMGSQLGVHRLAPLPSDVVWLDPVDIESGRLTVLRMPGAEPLVPLGIVLHNYLELKLRLRIAGFMPVCHAYDWRCGVEELGQELARRLNGEDAPNVAIVAHSMGGLVARAALAQLPANRVQRIILLGTPNAGSFAPLQGLRGVYAVVRKVARLSQRESAEELATKVFNSFQSLHDMLPMPGINGKLDFFDLAQWPKAGPQPDTRALARSRNLSERIAAGDTRFATIVGTGQETVTHAVRRNDQFVYTITRQGDGTVPTVRAELQGACNYYARIAHSELTRDAIVTQAVADILRSGHTRRLATRRPRGSRAQAQISDSALRRTHLEKVNWAHLSPDDRRIFLETLNEPPQLKLQLPTTRMKRRRA